MFHRRPMTPTDCSPLLSATATFARSFSRWIPCAPSEGSSDGEIHVRKTSYALLFVSVLLLQPVLHAAAAVKSEFFTTSDGVKLHYLESGAGPSILFVPGWTMPANIWQPQIDYFSRHYHVVAIDPRSQGDSEKTPDGNYPGRRAQDYKELIDHLGGSPVVMVGWSLGVQESLTYV